MSKDKSFEDKLEALEGIVEKLESGELPLDNAIDKYTEAMKLVSECDDKLKDTREKIGKIMKENGEVEDFDTE
jgi:exodeoxyribonuclease VII small subunit